MAEIQYARIVHKSADGPPTIPPSASHDNGDWVMTDIYEYELYVDKLTGFLYTRVGANIELLAPLPTVTEVGATNTKTNNSTSYVLLDDMILTPSAGTYLVMFSGSCFAQDTHATEMQLYVDGSAVATSHRVAQSIGSFTANEPKHSVSFQEKITVNGSQVVEVMWKVSNGAATGEFYERKLTLMKCSPL